MPRYRLRGAYWDGAAFHPARSVVDIEGSAPKSAEPFDGDISKAQAEEEAAADEAKALAATKAAQGPKAATVKKG